MRVMILLKADKNTEAGLSPSTELIGAMMKDNEELTKAGVLLAGEGLQPSSKGTRIKFAAGKRTVIDGPFPELRELIAGFWMFQVSSKEEAIEWVKRCPDPVPGGEYEIEIRQVFEASDFETMTPELGEKEEGRRARVVPGGVSSKEGGQDALFPADAGGGLPSRRWDVRTYWDARRDGGELPSTMPQPDPVC